MSNAPAFAIKVQHCYSVSVSLCVGHIACPQRHSALQTLFSPLPAISAMKTPWGEQGNERRREVGEKREKRRKRDEVSFSLVQIGGRPESGCRRMTSYATTYPSPPHGCCFARRCSIESDCRIKVDELIIIDHPFILLIPIQSILLFNRPPHSAIPYVQ